MRHDYTDVWYWSETLYIKKSKKHSIESINRTKSADSDVQSVPEVDMQELSQVNTSSYSPFVTQKPSRRSVQGIV